LRFLSLGTFGSEQFTAPLTFSYEMKPVIAAFFSSYFLSRFRGNYMLVFNLGSPSVADLLLVVTIPERSS
jgi:hypothetical protein